jgi:hypothetical protein
MEQTDTIKSTATLGEGAVNPDTEERKVNWAGYKSFEARPDLSGLKDELTETPEYDTLNDLNNNQWKHDWSGESKGETYTSMSSKYKGVQINSVDIIPWNILKPVRQFFEVAIYGEENREFLEYHARIYQSSGAFEINGKSISYIRFSQETPLETVVKFIDDFRAGILQGLLDERMLEEEEEKPRVQSSASFYAVENPQITEIYKLN